LTFWASAYNAHIITKEYNVPNSTAIQKADSYQPVQLGDNRLLINSTPEGQMVAIKADVPLSIESKDVVVVQGNPVITASGYDKLNKVANVSLAMPKRIEVPGHGLQPNPFFLIDEATGGIKFVMAKMSAVGYSPVGNLCVVDQTLLFDLHSYFKMDCLAKIKKNKSLGRITSKQLLNSEEQQYGYFVPILDANYGIYMDTRNDEFMKIVSDHSQRQRFAERIALGILKRNCLKHHPAIGITNVTMNRGMVGIPVIAWRKDVDMEAVRKVTEAQGERDGVETIEATIRTDEIVKEDMVMATAETVESEQDGKKETAQTTITPEPEEETGYEPTPREKHMVRIGEMKEALSKEEWEAFWNKIVVSGRPLEEFSEEELERFVDVLNEHLAKLGR
jgi:hypothetical protein